VVTADEERTAVGDHREDEGDHYFSSYSRMQDQPRFKLLILWPDRLLMTNNGRIAHFAPIC
jgi:hypothetical protein